MMNFYLYGYGLDKEDLYKQPLNDFKNRITEKRLQSIEHIIKKDAMHALWYAWNVIGGRWPEADPYIIKDIYFVYIYTKYVMNSRWLEAEPYIMKDPYYACQYARSVMNSRWLEAEPHIMTNERWWDEYKTVFNI